MNDYLNARVAAVSELRNAVKERDKLDKRIAQLKQTILSLEALLDSEIADTNQEMQVVGITDACRNALKIANKPLTAKDVRDWLANSGYDFSEQENVLASIHTVLKRLVKAGEATAELIKDKSGRYMVYTWAPEGFQWSETLTKTKQRIARMSLKALSSVPEEPGTVSKVPEEPK